MVYKSLSAVARFTATDLTNFAEVLHPKNDNIDTNFSLGHARIVAGQRSLRHVLKACSETYYILRGTGIFYIEDKKQLVAANDVVFIPAGSSQYLVNTGDDSLDFLVIVEPAWFPEQDELLEQG